MAYSEGSNIKREILDLLSKGKPLRWGEVVGSVSDKVGLHGMYVERELGALVQSGQVKQVRTCGLPQYSLSSGSPGHIEGKYESFTDKRLELEKEDAWGEDPRNSNINGPKAV